MKKRGGNGCVTIALLAIAGIVMLLSSIKNLKFIFSGEADDLNEIMASGETPEVGDVVGLKVRLVIDWYAELTERGTRGSRNITYHCMVMLDNGKVISLSVERGDNYDKIDRLIDESYDFFRGERTEPPTPVYMDGVIRKIDSEIKQYYYTGLALWKINPQQDAYILEVDTTQSRGIITIMFVFGVCITIGAVVFVVLYILNEKDKAEARKAEANAPITVADNDPIFNKTFYDNRYLYGRTGDSDDESIANDNVETEADSEVTESSAEEYEDVTGATEKKSKFSLKKD